jgi:hypothetical protein
VQVPGVVFAATDPQMAHFQPSAASPHLAHTRVAGACIVRSLPRRATSRSTYPQQTPRAGHYRCGAMQYLRCRHRLGYQLRRQARSVEGLAVEEVEDFSLYRTLVEQDPLPYSDPLHVEGELPPEVANDQSARAG